MYTSSVTAKENDGGFDCLAWVHYTCAPCMEPPLPETVTYVALSPIPRWTTKRHTSCLNANVSQHLAENQSSLEISLNQAVHAY